MKHKVIAIDKTNIEKNLEMLTTDNLDFFLENISTWTLDKLPQNTPSDIKTFYKEIYQSITTSINYYLKFANLFFIKDTKFGIAGYAVYNIDRELGKLNVEQWVKNPWFHNEKDLNIQQRITALKLFKKLLEIALSLPLAKNSNNPLLTASLVTEKSRAFGKKQMPNALKKNNLFCINRAESEAILTKTKIVINEKLLNH